jgi:hypothetical protein
MKKFILLLFLLFLSCNYTLKAQDYSSPNDFIGRSYPLCADSPLIIAAGIDREPVTSVSNLGCTNSSSNPAWFYINISSAGTHTIDLTSLNNVSVNFSLWGPFKTRSLWDIYYKLNDENIRPATCSSSSNFAKKIRFTSTSDDETWVLLITNPSNRPTDISVFQSAGTGKTDCSIVPCSGTTLIRGKTTVCNSSPSSFSTSSNGVTSLVYSLSPSNAGNIDLFGEVTWDRSFVGQATISVVASYQNCDDARASLLVDVSAGTQVFLSTPPTAICKGERVAFTATSTDRNSSTTYDFRVNEVSHQNDTRNTFVQRGLVDGDVVKVIQTNNFCDALSNSVVVRVIPATYTAYLSDKVIKLTCDETEILYTVKGTNLEGAVYDFVVNGVSVQNGSQNTYRALSLQNDDEVYAIVTKDGCQTTTFTMDVDGLYRDNMSVVLTTSSFEVSCQAQDITFTPMGSNLENANFDFQVNGISVQNGTQNTFTTSSLVPDDSVAVVVSKQYCEVKSRAITIKGKLDFKTTLSASAFKICPNTEVIFRATTNPVVQNLTYNFKKNGVSVQNSTQNTFVSSSLSSTDKITVTASSSACKVQSNTIIIQVVEELSVHLSASKTSICRDEQIIFRADEGLGNYNFKINGNSVQNSSSNTFISTSILNTDVVSVFVSNGNCQATSNSIILRVNPKLSISLSASRTVLSCQEPEIIFTATANQEVIYDFRINGISVQNDRRNAFSSGSLPVSALLKENDVIEVIAKNGFCETVSNKIVIRESLNLDVILSTSKTNLTCQDEEIYFYTLVSSDLRNGNYDFRINDISVQSDTQNYFSTSSLSIPLKDEDKITVIVTKGDCKGISNAIDITLDEEINVELLASKTTIDENEDIIFTANSDTENGIYDFRINDISVQNGNSSVFNSNSVSILLKNNDVVTVIITKGICSAESSEITITIEENKVGIYPNPTPNKITYKLTSESEGVYTIRIFDALGKSVWQQERTKEDTFLKGILNLESLAKGMYMIEFTDENETRIFKILKE